MVARRIAIVRFRRRVIDSFRPKRRATANDTRACTYGPRLPLASLDHGERPQVTNALGVMTRPPNESSIWQLLGSVKADLGDGSSRWVGAVSRLDRTRWRRRTGMIAVTVVTGDGAPDSNGLMPGFLQS
jgi:hypothetical protein